ncbi:hypothetical protein CGMCC3_g18083 [Colletotrichum fructicola]|nr:uncharacterized protein CGMCC3_g18083 [Colletotrichum fructicola]KAE9565734.1 hypothetical protein CGMCC3_g18083 [Colletotrichum fructicola]
MAYACCCFLRLHHLAADALEFADCVGLPRPPLQDLKGDFMHVNGILIEPRGWMYDRFATKVDLTRTGQSFGSD